MVGLHRGGGVTATEGLGLTSGIGSDPCGTGIGVPPKVDVLCIAFKMGFAMLVSGMATGDGCAAVGGKAG